MRLATSPSIGAGNPSPRAAVFQQSAAKLGFSLKGRIVALSQVEWLHTAKPNDAIER